MKSLRYLFLARQLCVNAKWLHSTEPHRTQACRTLHTPPSRRPPQTKSQSSLITYEDVFDQEQRSKASFVEVLDLFCNRDIRRRGHVELIEAALKWMPEFGVEKDLEVYNKLLDVFPKEVFVSQNYIQRMFNHYPRQQECAIRVLEQMENYGITPNSQTRFLLLQIFGDRSHPMRKYQRLMYWFPRFKHTNPFPVPETLADPVDLSKACLQRITADKDARTTVYQMPSTEEIEDGEGQENTYIVGIQSPDQVALLAEHDTTMPVLVEGPHPLWLRKTCVYYYVLRADPSTIKKEVEVDPERSLYYPISLDLDLERDFSEENTFDVEEVNEGPVFAMCMASSGDERTLGKWIQGLQETNPILGKVPVLFRLISSPHELAPVEIKEKEKTPEVDEEVENEPVHRRMEQ
ncbi:evolutionarily conserved signaling intermediate in Toll pathway, mitochondrial [Pelobates fuscus]|uniref:evolutionarily conserved signaling intermediate in Toll pathway, mitochondrial n=1 Tax=Pelobates fuscus TaxID=191477 RepID=UPI002FE49445